MAILTPRLDAVLLVGDQRSSIPLKNDNKGFLELAGVPLFVHVLRALRGSKHVRDVVVVGPSERIEEALQRGGVRDEADGLIRVVEQRQNMIENFMVGYVASLGLAETVSFQSLRGSEYEQVPVLVAPCDLPLLTSLEVDEFCERSNLHEYDYAIGVTSERVLSRYYPCDGKPGVRMIYFHVREDLLRHNNLHLARPLLFTHLDYVEKMYEWRYQTRLANVLRMLGSLFFGGWRLMRGFRIILLMQLSLYYDRHGHPALSDRLRSWVCFNRLAEGVGQALGARVQLVYTHLGGAAVDADNERDLAVIEARYAEWMAAQRKEAAVD